MSLINDALKKAKQAQATAPVRESAPQLRSAETDHPVRSGPSLILPAIIVAGGLFGAALVWVAMSGRKPEAQKTDSVVAVSSPPSPFKTGQAVAPTATEVVSTTPTAVLSVPTKLEPTIVTPPPSVAAPASASLPPAPVLPKLNGIFYNPTKPTAIVNNKLVSTGSRVAEFTVLAITQSSVTIAGGGQTNVLSLSE